MQGRQEVGHSMPDYRDCTRLTVTEHSPQLSSGSDVEGRTCGREAGCLVCALGGRVMPL